MSSFETIVELGRRNDRSCAVVLRAFEDPEVVGELVVALYRTGTAEGVRAIREALARPFRRGFWQGFKRVYKLAEEARDAETFALCAHTVDLARRSFTGPVSPRTVDYLKRRTFRHLKRLAVDSPAAFLAHLEALLPRYAAADDSRLLERVLRLEAPQGKAAAVERFAARVANPFAREADDAFVSLELLDLSGDELLRASPVEPAAPPAAPKRSRPLREGPIFAELWVREPERLVRLLERVRHAASAGAIARLLVERVGEGLLGVELERFYALLQHPVKAAARLGLSQIAGRVRQSRLRFDELVPVFERAVRDGPEWDAIADLLYVFDDERAEVERVALTPALVALLVAHPDVAEIGAVAGFARRHLAARLGLPLLDAARTLALLESRRADVRELGRLALARLAPVERLTPPQLERLLATPIAEEEPAAIQELLRRGGPERRGYRPPGDWPTDALAGALERLPEAGFLAARRALFAEPGPRLRPVAFELARSGSKRVRAVALELLGELVAHDPEGWLEVTRVLGSPHEDVIVWARERIGDAAAAGRLPNEALYRMLDATAPDVTGFARRVVRQHLARFELAELVVFCAESPDAATADLGIELYEKELVPRGLDLRALVPMFRVLLFKVATARREKDRLHATLRRFATGSPENARLAVAVVAELRRTEARLDRSRALVLLALVKDRFPEVAVPLETAPVFGAGSG